MRLSSQQICTLKQQCWVTGRVKKYCNKNSQKSYFGDRPNMELVAMFYIYVLIAIGKQYCNKHAVTCMHDLCQMLL